MFDQQEILKIETLKKVNNLTKDFEECAQLIENITSEASSTNGSSSNSSKRSSPRRSDSVELNSNTNINQNHSSSYESPPSMYRYYNPPTIKYRNSHELSRSLSPPSKRVQFQDNCNNINNSSQTNASQELNTPASTFIKNSLAAFRNFESIKNNSNNNQEKNDGILLNNNYKNTGMLHLYCF